jgi:hypothetical protein
MEEHIQNAFKKTGIWPLALENVLSTIRKILDKPSTLTKSGIIKTPKTTWAIRRAYAIYQREAESPVLSKIFNTNIQLAAQVAIQQHIIAGLQATLKLEKQRRKKGKALNLVGESGSGPQFYSPSRINRALEYQADLSAQAEAEKVRIADKKVQSAINKAQKVARQAERALQAEARWQHAAEEKARKAAEASAKRAAKQAELAAKKAAIAAKKAAKAAATEPLQSQVVAQAKRKSVVVSISGSPKRLGGAVIKRTSWTRVLVTPPRFKE